MTVDGMINTQQVVAVTVAIVCVTLETYSKRPPRELALESSGVDAL